MTVTSTVPRSATPRQELAAANPLPASIVAPAAIREASDAATEAIGVELQARARLTAARRQIPRRPQPGHVVDPQLEQAVADAAREHDAAVWKRLEAQAAYVAAILADPDWLEQLQAAAARADDEVGAALEQVRAVLEERLVSRQAAAAVERVHAGLGPGQLDFRGGRLDHTVTDALDRLAAVT